MFAADRLKETPMFEQRSKAAAQGLMSTHGLRAQAVVNERIEEARQQGDATSLAHWRNVELAIRELRRTGAQARRA